MSLLLLVVPLLGATAATGQGGGPHGGPSARPAASAASHAPDAPDARGSSGARDATHPLDASDPAGTADYRIAYAGTRHRSLGTVASTDASLPLFGTGPTHFDTQPSALGRELVFVSRRDEPKPQVYLRAADGSVRKLTSGRDAAHPRLTPDGDSVVFDSAEPGGPGGATQRDLWLVRTDGTGLTRLTDTPADEESPSVSADGQRLAYSCDSAPTTASGLRNRTHPAAGSRAGTHPAAGTTPPTRTAPAPGPRTRTAPAPGPRTRTAPATGPRTAADQAADTQIYVRPLAGGPVTLVSDPANGAATEPVWNPADDAAHRDLLAYTATAAAGRPHLRVTDGRTDRPLLGGDLAQWRAHGAAWLPGGDELLFLSPEVTCQCEGDRDHVFRTTAFSADVPSLVLSEDREVSSPTWLGPLSGGGAVVERDTAPNKCDATLQDIRPDGTDPRDLGVTVLEEDPAASTDPDPTHDPLFHPANGYDPWTERQTYTPDGRRIAVTAFEGPAAGRIERISTVDADGTGPAHLPLDGREPADWDTDPAYSPDGASLAFTRTSPGGVGDKGGPGRILIADVASGRITGRITPPDAADQDAQPAWSPDGTALVFTRATGGVKHIMTVPRDDLTAQRDLSAGNCPAGCAVVDDSPAYSPDGRAIVFNRKDSGPVPDQRDGLVRISATGGDCAVLLPAAARGVPGACGRPLPDTTATGPYQPRDAAWTADGKGIVFSSRADVAADSPEKLRLLDVASGAVTSITATLPGRQKEPAVRQSVDLAVRAPGTVPRVTVGHPATVAVDLVNHGPAASPGTRLTADPPAGVRITALTWPGGVCDPASLQCDVGVVPPGGTVTVRVTLVGDVPGDARIGWSLAGTVEDPEPGDNAAETVVPVVAAAPPPTAPPPPTPPPTPPPPAPPLPTAGPGVSVTARPDPGYVGGHVVVTYTVRNGRNALATGLRLRVGLPAGIPHAGPPPGCDRSWTCALPDLDPGASTVLRVVLSPDKALTGTVTGVLTTTGTDANPRDNSARQRLRILRPHIVAVPAIGRPGFVTSVRGTDFPPGVPVRFTWNTGITAAAAPTVPQRDGTFIGQLLIMTKDQAGPRVITASGPGFMPATTPFLVVSGSVQPPDEVTRR